MRRLGIDDKQLKPRAVLSHISWAKNHMLDPQEVYLQLRRSQDREESRTFTRTIARNCAKPTRSISTICCWKTVRAAEISARETREHYKRRYHYLLIDEYQDTNRPQYELMRAAGRHASQRLRRRR